MLSNNYPPGVTGNEPHLTGEWPCFDCDGAGYDEDEDGKHGCERCNGSGIEPEEYALDYLRSLVADCAAGRADRARLDGPIEAARCCVFDRGKPQDREYLRLVCKLWAFSEGR